MRLLGMQPLLLPRLCKDLQLQINQAEDVLTELIKFLYLHKLQSARFTPSKVVDEAWHVFLLFTRTYQEFCNTELGKFVHHEPGSEDVDSKTRFKGQYENTIEMLKRHFGEADKKWWPHGISIEAECGSCESIQSD